MSTLTLTRDEASAIANELTWTADSWLLAEEIRDLLDHVDTMSPASTVRAIEDLQRASARLRLEATIRNSGGWWGRESPSWLDLQARYGDDDVHCPDAFSLSAEGADALRAFCVDHLPGAIAGAIAECDEKIAGAREIDRPDVERRKAALVSLAGRLGIEIPTGAVS